MTMRLSRTMESIVHRGVRITYVNYEGLSGEDLANEINNNHRLAMDLAKNRAANRDGLILVNVANASFTGSSVDAMKISATELKPFIAALAAVGVTGLQSFILDLFGSVSRVATKEFASIDQAKDWLVDQLR